MNQFPLRIGPVQARCKLSTTVIIVRLRTKQKKNEELKDTRLSIYKRSFRDIAFFIDLSLSLAENYEPTRRRDVWEQNFADGNWFLGISPIPAWHYYPPYEATVQ